MGAPQKSQKRIIAPKEIHLVLKRYKKEKQVLVNMVMSSLTQAYDVFAARKYRQRKMVKDIIAILEAPSTFQSDTSYLTVHKELDLLIKAVVSNKRIKRDIKDPALGHLWTSFGFLKDLIKLEKESRNQIFSSLLRQSDEQKL